MGSQCSHDTVYGGSCHRCGHMRHNGEPLDEAFDWWWGDRPQRFQRRCASCSFCADDSFHRFLMAHGGLDLFTPDVRDAVKAMRGGGTTPLVDRLRDEIRQAGPTTGPQGEKQ